MVITKHWVNENEKNNMYTYFTTNRKCARALGRTCAYTKLCKLTKNGIHTPANTLPHVIAHKPPHPQAHTNSLYFSNPFFPRSTTVQLHSNPCIICWMNKDFFYVVMWIKPILRCINDLFFLKFLLSVLSTFMTSTLLKNIRMCIIRISIQRRILLIEIDISHTESMKI